ncbi:MAG: 3-deoxy-D-manno-octulosonic acid transferase [Bacteroidales bacterium]|nr:3-deoxy-D-manno-octulosonic acid transferase [Bacteroidales bacterium]
MWLYRIFIHIYWLSARFLSLFNDKAALFVNGRKKLFYHLEGKIPENKNVIWFHCASLGEFEQGRPVIEAWKMSYPGDFVLLTFFSPSGYEVRKNYTKADLVTYLPVDTKQNATRFIKAIHPQKIIFVKYEFWLNYIDAIHNQRIPLYLVSGIFRQSQHFFKWYGGIFRKRLHKFEYFFLQNKNSANLLNSIGIQNYTISGDTRFDRVYEITQNVKSFNYLEQFSKNKLVIVAGSTWPADEKLIIDQLIQKYNGHIKIIIAPHQVDEPHIQQLKKLLPGSAAYWTEIRDDTPPETDILVINTIGILSSVYQYADIAYIGGGFGKGIHNTLEAAAFGIPVIFGPNYKQFREARDLIRHGAACSVKNSQEFKQRFDLLITNTEQRKVAGSKARQYVFGQTGATKRIVHYISESKTGSRS